MCNHDLKNSVGNNADGWSGKLKKNNNKKYM